MTSLVATNQYLPQSYDLDIDIASKPNFSGQVSIKLQPNRPAEDGFTITLHCASLIILEAKIAQTVLAVQYDKPAQLVTLSCDSRENFADQTLVIRFLGTVNTIKHFRDQTKGVFKTNYLDELSGKSDNIIIATQTQPNYARSIFPLIDEPAFKVPITLQLTTPEKLTVVSNSPIDKVDKNGPTKTVRFEQTPPILSSNFGFIVGDLEFIEQPGPIPIRIYTPIGESTKAQFALDTLTTILPKAVEAFGEYPLKKLDFVALPFLMDGATENWGLVTVMKDHLLLSNDSQKPIIQQLVSHELIHQWIGNLVSFDEWKYLWLNESFATLLGNYLLVLAGLVTSEQFTREMVDMNTGLIERNSKINIQKFMNSLPTSGPLSTATLFNNDVYEKGIILLRMIANVVSDDIDDFTNFLAKLKQFIADNKFKSVKPNEIWRFIYADLKFDLLSLINIYLRYDGFPTLNVYENNQKLVVEQINKNQFHIPLYIKTTQGISKQIMTEKKVELDFSIEQLVLLNVNKVGHYHITMSKKLLRKASVDKLDHIDSYVYESEQYCK